MFQYSVQAIEPGESQPTNQLLRLPFVNYFSLICYGFLVLVVFVFSLSLFGYVWSTKMVFCPLLGAC